MELSILNRRVSKPIDIYRGSVTYMVVDVAGSRDAVS